jgi:chorismate mutase
VSALVVRRFETVKKVARVKWIEQPRFDMQ